MLAAYLTLTICLRSQPDVRAAGECGGSGPGAGPSDRPQGGASGIWSSLRPHSQDMDAARDSGHHRVSRETWHKERSAFYQKLETHESVMSVSSTFPNPMGRDL